MKITVVCDVLGEANNGTSQAAYNLIKILNDRGHEVNIICPDENRRGQDHFFVVGTLSLGPIDPYVKKNGVTLAKGDMDVIDAACKDADIIHIMLPLNLGSHVTKYGKEHHIPVSAGFHFQAENFTSHIYAMDVAPINRVTYHILKNSFYDYVDNIHFPTQFICDYVKHYHIKAESEYVISNGVIDLFRPMEAKKPKEWEDKFIVLMSGRYSKEKQQILLLKAVNKSKYRNKIQIILCGSGPNEHNLRKYADKYMKDIYPHFEMCNKERLHELICMSDLYVHTSKIEIEAVSCLEAIACGKVPVISNSPRSATSCFSLVPESSFNYKSYKDLKNKIEFWMENPEYLNEVAPRYAEYGQQFNFNTCMDRMEKMLVEVYQRYERKKDKQS